MLIKVKVKTGAKKQKVVKISDEEYVVFVKNPPIKGKANRELIKVLKEYFKKEVRIVSGEKSRNKIIEILD